MFTSTLRFSLVWCAVVAFSGGTAEAKPRADGSCPAWRPCGGGETWGGNRFIPQSRAGADFRPVCAAHDKCYEDSCKPRKQCDKEFLDGLNCACASSSRPRACQRRAKLMYVAVRLFGSSDYGENP